jgi:predicted PurR-regulated permease PerM
MSNLFMGLITLAIVVGVIIFIFVMIELKKAIGALRELVKTTDNSLKPTVIGLQETLKSVRNVAENTTAITGDMKLLSGALKDLGENMKHVSGDVKHLVGFVDGMTQSALVEASGIKAGVKAGFGFFLKNLFK